MKKSEILKIYKDKVKELKNITFYISIKIIQNLRC